MSFSPQLASVLFYSEQIVRGGATARPCEIINNKRSHSRYPQFKKMTLDQCERCTFAGFRKQQICMQQTSTIGEKPLIRQACRNATIKIETGCSGQRDAEQKLLGLLLQQQHHQPPAQLITSMYHTQRPLSSLSAGRIAFSNIILT